MADSTHVPNAERQSNWKFMPSGIYCFPARQDYLKDLVAMASELKLDATKYRNAVEDYYGRSNQGRHPNWHDFVLEGHVFSPLYQYLYNLGLNPSDCHVFVVENLAQNPLIVTSKEQVNDMFGDLSVSGAKKVNRQNDQQKYIGMGYDAIYDPHSLIDSHGDFPQYCFLTNAAFKVIDAYKVTSSMEDLELQAWRVRKSVTDKR